MTLEDVPTDTNLLMVATGTGLGPYISMLRTHAYEFPADQIGIIHGARYSWDLGYRPELEAYDSRFNNVHYLPHDFPTRRRSGVGRRTRPGTKMAESGRLRSALRF